MGIVVLPKTLTEHTTAKATDVMADLNKILETLNGGIDAANIAALGVGASELADLAVTSRSLRPTSFFKLLAEVIAANGGVKVVPAFTHEFSVSVESAIDFFLNVSHNLERVSATQMPAVLIYIDGEAISEHTLDEDQPVGTIGNAAGQAVFSSAVVAPGTHKVEVKFIGKAGGEFGFVTLGAQRTMFRTLVHAV